MKAFRQDDGRVHIFRPDKHFHRLNKSLERMCMPVIDEALFHSALSELIRLEQDWLPHNNDISLYIRPFVIATEPRLGVKVSDEYLFIVVCSPLAAYYAEPLRVKIETQYVRASEGGAGYAKCGGNYGAAFYPTQKAKEEGYDQIIWTDAKMHTFLEEAGTMNIMVIRGNKLITPLSGETILEGVTKNSIIHIAKELGIEVEERSISYNELVEAFTNEEKVEIFGCGTAAVVSPIKCININGTDYYPYIKEDALMFKLKTVLDDIRKGRHQDTFGWNYFV
jgi:branched-chain amino acid aminotransferase